MVESIFGYLALLAIFTILVEIANYLNTRRVRLPTSKRCFLGLNVSSVPVSLAEIRRQEYEAQLDEVSREIEQVSLLIEIYELWDVPSDELERFFVRKERLIARYKLLAGGEPFASVVTPIRIRTPKALSAVKPSALRARPRRTNSSNNIQ